MGSCTSAGIDVSEWCLDRLPVRNRRFLPMNIAAAVEAPRPVDDLDLDVRIVESGDAAEALLGSTDNGCDTVRGSDC